MSKRWLAIVLFLLAAAPLAATPAPAQDKATSTNDILRAKLQADKKLIVAANMDLSDAEAKGFWPVYDAYQAELQKANDRILALITAYASVFRSESTDADQAKKLIDERIAIDQSEVERDRTFVPKLSAVLPPRKVIRYMQIEAKVRAVVRYELADRIPLIQ